MRAKPQPSPGKQEITVHVDIRVGAGSVAQRTAFHKWWERMLAECKRELHGESEVKK